MSRKEHTPEEKNAFEILSNHLTKKTNTPIKNQIDNPDFGFIQNGKRFGVEVCSIDNQKLLESVNTYKSKKLNKARKKELDAINNSKPLTKTNIIISTKKEVFRKILLKKFSLYKNYQKTFDAVFLLLFTKWYYSPTWENLKVSLNNFCINEKCPFEKVFLVDLQHNSFIGEIFNKEEPQKIEKSNPQHITRQQISIQYFPTGREFKIFNHHK